jgi:SAM-dependent methyltransferase
MHDDRHGAKQPERFDPARAARLDDPARFEYLPPAELLALLELDEGATLVDFGTGTGAYAVEVARARPDVLVYALDENEAMLAHLREKLAKSDVTNVTPIEPAELAPLKGRVDRVLALNVLHELGDASLAELRGLLASAGKALIVDWNADAERPHGPPREHVYGVEEARRRLRDSGLSEIGLSSFPYHYAFVVVPSAGIPQTQERGNA